VIRIEIAHQQSGYEAEELRIRQAIEWVLAEAGIADASISVAILDDPSIRELNARYLNHDYATDVLSFLLDDEPGAIEGEVIVSADTAATMARRFGWSAADELLLYVVHGTLHLVGHDDQDPESLAVMRAAEKKCLAQLGIEARHDDAHPVE
jgi:probable rRNA maturation factor